MHRTFVVVIVICDYWANEFPSTRILCKLKRLSVMMDCICVKINNFICLLLKVTLLLRFIGFDTYMYHFYSVLFSHSNIWFTLASEFLLIFIQLLITFFTSNRLQRNQYFDWQKAAMCKIKWKYYMCHKKFVILYVESWNL